MRTIVRKTACFIFALVLLAGCTEHTNPVGSDASTDVASSDPGAGIAARVAETDVTHDVINLDIELPFDPSGVIACVGERMRLHGEIPYRIHTVVDGQGKTHRMYYYDWRNVVATGLSSGHTWHTTAGLELYSTLNYRLDAPNSPISPRTREGEPAVFHHLGAIRFKSDDGDPNLYVHHVIQTVVNPDGTVKDLKDHFELLECR